MSHPFAALTPDLVLDAVESIGFLSDARVLALNSYENRVYQVGIEDGEPLIAKFYRPARWSDAAILEEHGFTFELAECEVPVVAPLEHNGATLFEHAGFRFCLFPRRGGRAPEPGNLDQLYRLGQLLGRLHGVGASKPFAHREALRVQNFGHESLATLLQGDFVPRSLLPAYESVARDLLKRLDRLFAATPYQSIRLHGDCHPGNMLCRDEQFHLVDLDDCRMGPAVQDLWMMLAGDRQERLGQLSELMDGYQEFHDFDPRELTLIEGLRALRLLHYSAWLARRWDDPAFPRSFPWFGSERYWGEQVLALREQLAALDEEPLRLF
ncbi:MAG: serine/threonine protein kinase [Pseudomonas sp.]